MEKNEPVTVTLGKSEYAKVSSKKNGHANGNGVVRGASADLRAIRPRMWHDSDLDQVRLIGRRIDVVLRDV